MFIAVVGYQIVISKNEDFSWLHLLLLMLLLLYLKEQVILLMIELPATPQLRKIIYYFFYYLSASIILIIATVKWDLFWNIHIDSPFLGPVTGFLGFKWLIFFTPRILIASSLVALGGKLTISILANPTITAINYKRAHLNRLLNAIVSYMVLTVGIVILSSGLSLLIKSITILIFTPLILKYFGI